jgi:hypothetical protein
MALEWGLGNLTAACRNVPAASRGLIMAITITINGTVTYDESVGLQTGGVAVGSEDNNDNDFLLSTLQSGASTFYNRLFGGGGLGLSTTLATSIGIAKSADNYITLSGTGTINTLGFVDSSGGALPVLGSGTGAATNLFALDGGAISLFSDATLGSRVVYGVDTDGDIVFAMYMDANAGLTSAKVWMIEFEALSNPNASNFDDPLTLTGLGVGAGVSTEFNFSALPSGQNLFGTVGSASSGLIVFGKTPVLNPDGTFTNTSNTINTSQGGGPTTIGVNNQMFDPGEGAYFTFIKSPVPNYLAGAVNGLDQNEADDADNMQYTGGTIESDSAFVKISQIQGNSLATMTIEAFNIAGSPQGQALVAARGTNHVNLTQVKVYNAAGTLIEDTNDLAHFNAAAVVVTFTAGVATVTGLGAGYKVEFFSGNSSIKFDQVLISDAAGKFDIGGFGVNEPTALSVPLTGVRFEDDGPSVDLVLNGSAEVRVDESTLPVSDSILAADLFSTNTASFGTDGAGTDGSVYKLLLADDNSGLHDTATGDEVLLTINGDGTLITGAVNGGADVVFTIAVDPVTGEVTLTQMRALVNGDPSDPDESTAPLTLPTGLVEIQRALTDGDGDSASDHVDISAIFKFEDDGPSLPGATQADITLVTDDTDIADLATLSTDIIFPGSPNFGADGPNAVNPLDYMLTLASENADSGLVDTATGSKILLVTVGDDIVGYVDSNNDGSIGAGETLESIRYSLTPVDSDTETVTFTQSRAIFHALADPTETLNPNLVSVDRVATDGDGDKSEVVSVDLGAITFIHDDEPTIGPISDGLVDFALNSSVTNSLVGDVNNDPNSSPYILTSFTPSLTINGVDLHGVLSANSQQVSYWANTNNNGTFGDAGDTEYYRLTLNESGAGQYTFNVLVNPPPSNLAFDFAGLPSGQNLFGMVGSTSAALVVIGKFPVLNPDGTYSNASNTINTSQGGGATTIGVNNQMFDANEGAYFTFVKGANSNFLGSNLDSNEADDADNMLYTDGNAATNDTLESNGAFLKIAQIQGNSLATMKIAAFNITGSPQGQDLIAASGQNAVTLTQVKVYNASGTLIEDSSDLAHYNAAAVAVAFNAGVATVSGLNAGYKVEWFTSDASIKFDQVLVTDVAGKFDVGGFGINQSQPTPDQLLEFTARVTDGDADYASASWKIGIDGTGVFDDNHVTGVTII